MSVPPVQQHAAFTVMRDRDAWATIRGFAYQIALSVERWLNIGELDVLELEHGEDIDLCQDYLRNEGASQTRVLEQIKRLDGTVTLRNPAVVGFLASAHEHATANPNISLRFRFVSTATAAIERPTSLSPREPAIDRWQRMSAATPSNDQPGITAVRSILSTASKPTDLNDDTWQRFCSFITNADESDLSKFVQQVDWTLGHGDVSAVQSRSESTIVTLGYASSDTEARQAYQHLFLHLLGVLSHHGLKRLGVVELRRVLLERVTSKIDQGAFERLQAILSQHDERISSIESTLGMHQSQLEQLEHVS